MSFVQMTDTPTGLEANLFDYQGGVNEVDLGDGSNFIESDVVSRLSRAVPHDQGHFAVRQRAEHDI